MYNQLVNKKLEFLLAALICLPAQVLAENQTGFYEKNSARSVFGKAAKVKAPRAIEMLRPEKIEQDEEEIAEKITKNLTTTAKVEETSKEDENLSLEQKLEKKYGTPTEEFPVTGIESAPVPFRAMIEALDQGDKELAFKYAVQYVRYKRQLEEVTNQAVSLVGQGYVREGVLPADSWASSPEHQENFYLRNMDLGEEKLKTEKAEPVVSKLSLKAQEIIKRTKDEKFNLVDQEVERIDTKTLKIDEKTERELARKELKGKIPVDPKGEIDIYFFFDPKDKVAMGLAKDVQKIYEMSLDNKGLEFAALTTKSLSLSSARLFQSLTDTNFKITSGPELAKHLSVIKSPSFVFVCRNSAQLFAITEPRSLYYLEESLKIMQGMK